MNIIYERFGNIEMRGSKRNEILFKPNGVAHELYKNLERIYKNNAKEGDAYKEWLLKYKIPQLKDDLESALVTEFSKTGNEEEFWSHVDKLQENFRKYKEAIRQGYSELEFLKSYM